MDRIIRVGLYERVSTEEQALRGYSIPAQIAALEEFCKNNNMRIVDHYTDAGVSGGKAAFKRPEMSRLLEDIQCESRLSTVSNHGSPTPVGIPITAVSKTPPTLSPSDAAAKMASRIFSPAASSSTANVF